MNVLQLSFTGTIARGLSLLAIVVGGLVFAYGEGQGKRSMAGIIFGVGMAIGAMNFSGEENQVRLGIETTLQSLRCFRPQRS